MSTLELKGLDFTRSRNWLKRAEDCRGQDPVSAFIFAWISFNHYYSTFAVDNKERFRDWKKQYFGDRGGDKAEILFLVHSQEFIEFFDEYRTQYPQRLNSTIKLPVIDMLWHNRVPDKTSGMYKLYALTNGEIFRVMYQIRNNLFHGRKDPNKVQRDYDLCVTASNFMIPLVAALLTGTYGEVLNAYDDSGQELRDHIRKLAET